MPKTIQEYLRRNLLIAKALGIKANAEAAKTRMLVSKRPAKWMLKVLDGIIDRAEPLPTALAEFRGTVVYTKHKPLPKKQTYTKKLSEIIRMAEDGEFGELCDGGIKTPAGKYNYTVLHDLCGTILVGSSLPEEWTEEREE